MSTSEHPAKKHSPPYQSIFIAFLWLFLSSSLDSLSVFNGYVEQMTPDSGSLHGAWSMSMSFICLAAMPTMIASGVVIGQPICSTDPQTALNVKTRHIRRLVLFASLMYASLALTGLAVSNGSALGIWAFVTSPGAGFGVCYVTAVELLVASVPKRATFIVALGLMVFSFGVIIFADIFKWLIETIGVVKAAYTSAAIISIPVALTSLIVRWPSPSEDSVQGEEEGEQEEGRVVYLQPSRFLQLPVFWVFVLTFLILQAGAALYSYFLPIGISFSKSIETVIPYFQMGNFAGLVVRLPAAMLIEKMAFGTGIFSIGSKNMMIFLLVLQIMLMLLMWTFAVRESFVAFAWCAVTMWAVLSGSSTAAPILARDLFGKRNGAVAFGIATSISFGAGEFIAMYLMSLVDKFGGVGERKPWRFVPFYRIEAVATVITLFCCLALRRSREAFVDGTAIFEADEQIPLNDKWNQNHLGVNSPNEIV